MTSGIYKITINNKVYVGLSKNIEKRMSHHKHLLRNNRHKNIYLQNAYNKHKSFVWEVLEECDEWLGEKEIMWIEKLDTYKNGYNLNEGGDHPKHTEESKRKLSAANAGKNNAMYGKDWRVGKTKEELVAIFEGLSERQRARQLNRPMKPSTKEKLRKLNTGEKNPVWCGVSTEEMIDKVLEHQSVIKAAEEFGINKYTIRHRLKNAGYYFVYDGLKFSNKAKVIDVVKVKE